MLQPLSLSPEELQRAIDVITYLKDHPEENQNTGSVKKLKFVIRQWLDVDWKKNTKKEQLQNDKEALELTGIRSGRKKKKELQESWKLLQKNSLGTNLFLHAEDQVARSLHSLDEESTHADSVQDATVTDDVQRDVSCEIKDISTSKKAIYLKTSMICYVCKKEVKMVHHFYDQMCEPCGEFNYAKRNNVADLSGKVALVTGGRVKIGYETTLKLLRCGAFVIVTTRFPNDCSERYSREEDFALWKDRIFVYALDMRFLGEVEQFCAHVIATYPRLDIIINNAAQTIRRPPLFYEHLLEKERLPPKELIFHYGTPRKFLDHNVLSERALDPAVTTAASSTALSVSQSASKPSPLVMAQMGILSANSAPFEITQIPLIPEDTFANKELFPNGELDADGQQVDLRVNNSWILKLDSVSTVELAEVHMVNALAPFIINSKLKAMMKISGDKSFIINVSSMEGKFSRNKKSTHPHTNMAKASMNMMTRTSAKDFAEDHIYMNSVDTGWITYENPCELTEKKQQLGLEPPIDEIDGAARILDPVMTGVNAGEFAWGLF